MNRGGVDGTTEIRQIEWMDVCAAASAGTVLRFRTRGVQSLGILDREHAWQIVLLREPLMLPRPAEIT
jgi:hypothetical protein